MYFFESEVMKLLATIPHSGEEIPDMTPWLKNLPEEVLMCDVDRYVDRLYLDHLNRLGVPVVKTQWHRFAVDLNRIPEDVDCESVQGSLVPAGKNSRGYHWVMTTLKTRLMNQPMSLETHQKLTELIYNPFHHEVKKCAHEIRQNQSVVYHLDLHSMPSLGTSEHRDPGERRADIVVSDCHGKSSSTKFLDLVLLSYIKAGFKVAYNWPYYGGRVSEVYGRPNENHHTIQVELNRALYMNETTKQLIPDLAAKTSEKLGTALDLIIKSID